MSPVIAAPSFDLKRAILSASALYPVLRVNKTCPLKEAIDKGSLAPSARMLVMDVGEHALVFEATHLIYHHVATGVHEEQPWVASFCSICNGGAIFDARVDGELRQFEPRGFYNAMSLLGDVETGSYWDHITGECVYGDSVGKRLIQLTTLLHQSAQQAAAAFPDAQLVLTTLEPTAQQEAEEDLAWSREDTPEWSERMQKMLADEDVRLPRLAMGLGVWSLRTQRYYPATTLHACDNVIFDTFDGRNLLIYIAPETGNPEAFFTAARSARWLGDVLRLDTGETTRDGVLYDVDGAWQPVERPLQLFYRWYGFALQFPNCEIYGLP
jgi:hypothetical protein